MPRVNIKELFKRRTTIRIILVIVVQTTFALLFDLFGLGAGSIGSFTFMNYAQIYANASTFIILLYPPLLASDGGIGVLVSKLGTALHIGTIKPQILKNTKSYYTIISSVLLLGTFNALWIGMISYITNLVTSGQSRVLNPIPFFVIPIMTLTLSSLICTQLASLLAFFIFKRKMNPDIWVYPTMSTINNIFSTLLYSAVIAIIQPKTWFDESGKWISVNPNIYFLMIFAILYLGFIGYIIGKYAKVKDFWKTIKQAIPIQSITLTVNSLTGGILSGADVAFAKYRALFLIYPALIDTMGDECSIISNTTSTNLALGAIEPKITAIKDKDLWTNVIGVSSAGIILHLLYGIFSSLIVVDFANMGIVIGISLAINIIGFLIVESIIYLILIFSYRKGLDPDNIIVPIIAAISNLVVSALILFFAFILPT
ncbi:MAG: magnesium transporter [Candidatus Thorarchaeota archaeon]